MAEKISAAQAAQVYSEVPGVLRALTSERDTLLEKNASLQEELNAFREADQIEKIARAMEEKQISIGESFEDKVERIKEAAAQGRALDVIAEAVEMTAPQGGFAKLGSELEPGNGDGETRLESYLLGGLSG